MKIILQDDRRYVLRFDKGEDVVAGLKDFMASGSITACAFQGIGAAQETELAFYNMETKQYQRKVFNQELEIVSIIGNGAMEGDSPIIHAHGSFSSKDFIVFGGHVFKTIVSATCEIFLIKLEGKISRGLNEEFNLKLLQ